MTIVFRLFMVKHRLNIRIFTKPTVRVVELSSFLFDFFHKKSDHAVGYADLAKTQWLLVQHSSLPNVEVVECAFLRHNRLGVASYFVRESVYFLWFDFEEMPMHRVGFCAGGYCSKYQR